MLKISPKILKQYYTELEKKAISVPVRNNYNKWLRFYLDFCFKYKHNPMEKESIGHFINKLKEKKQTNE